MEFDWAAGTFRLGGAKGTLSLIPDKRTWIVKFMGIGKNSVRVTVNGEAVGAESSFDDVMGCLTVKAANVAADASIEIRLLNTPVLNHNHTAQRLHHILQRAQIDNCAKEAACTAYHTYKEPAAALHQMKLRGVPQETLGVTEELLTAIL